MSTTSVVIFAEKKSMFLAVFLTLMFGPLGMLYVTVGGGIAMLVVSVLLGSLTFGIALFVLWPICVIWTYVAVRSHNKRIQQAAASFGGGTHSSVAGGVKQGR